jgi:adenylate kinase
MPPAKQGFCDKCGGSLYQRTDDKVETIKKRLDVYKNEVSDLIEYYSKQNKLHRLGADGEAQDVLKEIIALTK